MISLTETRDALQRSDAATFQVQEEWRKTLTQLAQIDQEDAKRRDEVLGCVVAIADRLVAAGKSLLKTLVLIAEREQLFQHLDAAWSAASTEEEKSAISSLLTSRERYTVPHTKAREFLARCASHVDSRLDEIDECLANEEFELARAIGQQARRITAAMREVHNAWPWTDADSLEESWRQYRNDELMDFETFKHELLKAAQ